MYACDFCLVDGKEYDEVNILKQDSVNLVICLDCESLNEYNKRGCLTDGKKIC